jgi:hypothetical protein
MSRYLVGVVVPSLCWIGIDLVVTYLHGGTGMESPSYRRGPFEALPPRLHQPLLLDCTHHPRGTLSHNVGKQMASSSHRRTSPVALFALSSGPSARPHSRTISRFSPRDWWPAGRQSRRACRRRLSRFALYYPLAYSHRTVSLSEFPSQEQGNRIRPQRAARTAIPLVHANHF